MTDPTATPAGLKPAPNEEIHELEARVEPVRGNMQGNDHESLTGDWEGPTVVNVWVDAVLEPTKLTPFH